ncbi:hypothetical protein CRUP_025331 [Coryphaenoides rupestris]|nr:hypothetical protein CRUP_025331 [Coryphaenoides rupestris]
MNESRGRLHLRVPQYPSMATMMRKQHTAMMTGCTAGEEVEVQKSPEEQQVSGWFSGSDEN